MNNFQRVFLDTAPAIYYVQHNERYFAKVKEILTSLSESGIKFVTSDITTAEACVYPYRLHKQEWLDDFDRFIERFFVEFIHTSEDIARKSTALPRT